jgi:hypothetical protein
MKEDKNSLYTESGHRKVDCIDHFGMALTAAMGSIILVFGIYAALALLTL